MGQGFFILQNVYAAAVLESGQLRKKNYKIMKA